jgi:hypothetical protein
VKKYFLLFFIFTLGRIHAQTDTSGAKELPKTFRDHLVWGGNIGLAFGNVTTIGVAPLVGYKITERFVAGVGGAFYYIKWHFPAQTPITSYIYGENIWSRFFLLPKIFLAGEVEAMNSEWDPYSRPGYRSYRESDMVGVGYREYYGGFSNYIILMYVLNSQESAYNISPIVLQAGFAFGM